MPLMQQASLPIPHSAKRVLAPTDEQSAIAKSFADILFVEAFAGTGKTAALIMYAQAHPELRFIYIAFNRAIKEEAAQRFPANVQCITSHGLAYRLFGRPYDAKLKLGGLKAFMVAGVFNISAKEAQDTIYTLEAFLYSSERSIGIEHALRAGCPEQFAHLHVEYAIKLWDKMCDQEDMSIPMLHDGYLKLYELADQRINCDVLLIDEYQDLNPVTLSIIKKQSCRKVFVGDSRQAIYGFRGAINASAMVRADERLYLTGSFRFGAGIAAIANAVLSAYSPLPRPLRGLGPEKTVMQVNPNAPHAVLSRTNGTLFSECVKVMQRSMPFGFVGGIESYQFNKVLDAWNLKIGKKSLVKDAVLRAFRNYSDLSSYADEVEDKEIKSILRVVDEYGSSIPDLVEEIKSKAIKDLSGNEVVFATAHRSKGLEFDAVILTDDFVDMKPKKDPDNDVEVLPQREEINLLYVALTRSKRAIQLPSHTLDWLSSERPSWSKCIMDACQSNQQQLPDPKYMSVRVEEEPDELVPAEDSQTATNVIPLNPTVEEKPSREDCPTGTETGAPLDQPRVLGDIQSFKCSAKRMKELVTCFPDDKNFLYMLKIATALATGEAVLMSVPEKGLPHQE